MKRRYRVFIVLFLLSLVIIVIVENKTTDKYWENQMHISGNDSINIIIQKLIINHGGISFNDSYMLNHEDLRNSTKEIDKLLLIPYPYKMQKEKNSDTIFFIGNDFTYFLILKNDLE